MAVWPVRPVHSFRAVLRGRFSFGRRVSIALVSLLLIGQIVELDGFSIAWCPRPSDRVAAWSIAGVDRYNRPGPCAVCIESHIPGLPSCKGVSIALAPFCWRGSLSGISDAEDIKEEGEFRNTDQDLKSVMYVTSDRIRQPHFIGTAIKPEQPDTQRGSTMIRKMIPVFTAAAISMGAPK